ncbi:hypothetical protein ACWEDF_09060 [Micromonospora chersina]
MDFATATAVPLPVVAEADIRRRLANGETGPTGIPDDGWDTYLDLA